ncbi:MAG: GNAT family N-acetyltransferase [Bacillota bacterium]
MYEFSQMTEEMALEIAYQWKYDDKYSFYDMTADEEDLKEFLESNREGYYIVRKDSRVIGYFCFEQSDSGQIQIGLGMKPEYTGKGLGLEFFQKGVEFALSHFQTDDLTLSVASFNKRAIKVYQKAGFAPVQTFMQTTNGSIYEFVKMKYEKGE